MLDHPAVTDAKMTCLACPEMWEGDLVDGSTFRLRYRHGWASLTIWRPDGEKLEAGDQVGDSLEGIFDSTEQRNLVFHRLHFAATHNREVGRSR